MSLDPKGGSKNGGHLDWGSPLYDGEISTKSVLQSSNTSSEWTVDMDAWQFTSDGQTVNLPGPGLETVVDPFYPNLFVPQAQAQLMCKSMYLRLLDEA
jgi:hypothetical protein